MCMFVFVMGVCDGGNCDDKCHGVFDVSDMYCVLCAMLCVVVCFGVYCCLMCCCDRHVRSVCGECG